jgi:hypothetical protein
LESRLILAIEVSKAAQPLIVGAEEPDADAPDEDAGEAGQVTLPGVEGSPVTSEPERGRADDMGSAMPPADDDGPKWPDEVAESGMRAEAAQRGETLSSKAAREAAEALAEAAAEKRNLPPLDDLINQIPADVRDTLEDLFKAKFNKVARAPKKSLKAHG